MGVRSTVGMRDLLRLVTPGSDTTWRVLGTGTRYRVLRVRRVADVGARRRGSRFLHARPRSSAGFDLRSHRRVPSAFRGRPHSRCRRLDGRHRRCDRRCALRSGDNRPLDTQTISAGSAIASLVDSRLVRRRHIKPELTHFDLEVVRVVRHRYRVIERDLAVLVQAQQ